MHRSRTAGIARWARLAVVAAPLLLASGAGAGGTYWRYTDAGGNVHFVDALERVPVHRRGQATEVGGAGGAPRVNRIESAPRPERRPFSDVPAALAPSRVVVYSAPWCGWCRRTLAWLDAKGVAYENRDIDADPAWKQELREKTGRTAIPVVQIGDTLVRGYSPERWEDLL